jgi:integrase
MAGMKKTDSGSHTDCGLNLNSKGIEAILARITDIRQRVLVRLLSESGCTASELVEIKVGDIKDKGILIGERLHSASARLWQDLLAMLRERKDYFPSAHLFNSRQSNKLDVRRVQQITKTCLGTSPRELRRIRIAEIKGQCGVALANASVGTKHLRERYVLDELEIARVRKSIDNPEHLLMFDVLHETGCLISELVALKLDHVRINQIAFGERIVHISAGLSSRLAKPMENVSPTGYIFKSRERAHVSDKRIFQILQSYGQAASITLNQRALRNTKIARMLSNRKSQEDIKRELGIKKLDTCWHTWWDAR